MEGRSIQVCTDHKPFIYSQQVSHDKAPAIRTRKIIFLLQFDIKYTHIESEANPVADALSRIASITVTSRSMSPEALKIAELSCIEFQYIYLQYHQKLLKYPRPVSLQYLTLRL